MAVVEHGVRGEVSSDFAEAGLQRWFAASPTDPGLGVAYDSGRPVHQSGVKQRPSSEDRALLKEWIAAGAPSTSAPSAATFLSENAVAQLIRDDLRALKPPERRFARVFERLALPGFSRGARFELLAALGAAGRYALAADSLQNLPVWKTLSRIRQALRECVELGLSAEAGGA